MKKQFSVFSIWLYRTASVCIKWQSVNVNKWRSIPRYVRNDARFASGTLVSFLIHNTGYSYIVYWHLYLTSATITCNNFLKCSSPLALFVSFLHISPIRTDLSPLDARRLSIANGTRSFDLCIRSRSFPPQAFPPVIGCIAVLRCV